MTAYPSFGKTKLTSRVDAGIDVPNSIIAEFEATGVLSAVDIDTL